jgi:four helix bundle protein
MGKSTFLELKVFRTAERLADGVFGVIGDWQPFQLNTVGERLVRAADGIGAAIATGHARGMPRESRRAVRAAFNETLYWLRRAAKRELLQLDELEQLKAMMDDLGRRISSYLRRMSQRGGPAAGNRED